jgi:hypothetical protein
MAMMGFMGTFDMNDGDAIGSQFPTKRIRQPDVRGVMVAAGNGCRKVCAQLIS